jgi:hypothetical protein
MLIGANISIATLVLFIFGNYLIWIRHLPGDIRIGRRHCRFYFPLATLALVNLLLFFNYPEMEMA